LVLIGLITFHLFVYYSMPIEGIMTGTTRLYSYPDVEQESSLLAGMKVHILNIDDKGDWLKVETQDGVMGYIPSRYIQSI